MMRRLPVWGWLALVAVVLLVVWNVRPPAQPAAPAPAPAQPARSMTVTGFDPASNADISPVNVWDDYQSRSRVVGQVRTGDHVLVLRQDGDGVLVQLTNGRQGWVSRWFIKGL